VEEKSLQKGGDALSTEPPKGNEGSGSPLSYFYNIFSKILVKR
jgi:hypothetical protein